MSVLDELYLQRRMEIASRAQDLSPSMQFDLALSPLANHEIDEAVNHFNPKAPKEGWGFANVFEEMLSREPRRVPVEDLATLQENLKNQGYLPPDHPADGVWGPDSGAAFNQFDRDNGDQVRQGNSILAGTVQDGVRFFGSMLPRSVIQGVIGTAKGLVEQAPETLERAGAAGGAAAGAAIGATAGATIAPFTLGTSILVGAAIGGIGGLLSSLLDNDDEDGNGNKGILDALHPFNEGEWTTARNFAEDVGFVATAASMISGGAAITRGVAGLGTSTLRGSLTALAPTTKPGFVMNMLGTAKGSTTLGVFAGGAHGLATGDDMGDVFESAVVGGAAGFVVGTTPVGAALRQKAAEWGLKRIHTNPVIKGINSVYTGGVQINVAGRYAGGFGSGEKDTAIEQNIRDAPMILPEWADTIGALVLLPTRILPVGLGQIGSAARTMMGSTAKRGYFHALETAVDPVTGIKFTKSKTREIVDGIEADQDLFTRRDFGIKKLTDWTLEGVKADDANALAKGEGKGFFARADKDALELQAKNAVIDWYNSDPETNLPLVLGMSTADDAAWMKELVAQQQLGSGVLQWPKYKPAQIRAELLGEAARQGKLEYRVGSKSFGIAEEGAVATATKEVTMTAATERLMTQRNWREAKDEYIRLTEEAKRARAAAESIGDDVAMAEQSRLAWQAATDAATKRRVFMESFRDPTNPYRRLDESVVEDGLMGTMVTTGKGKAKKESYAFADFLEEKAKHAAIDVDGVSPELVKDITDNGYKLVATNEKILRLTDVVDNVAIHDVGDYTKRASFFETAGLSPFKITEQQIGEIKQQHMQGMLNDASAKLGVALPGDNALHKLVDELHSLNNAGLPLDQVAARHGPFVEVPGTKAWIRRQRFLKVDLRQLKLDDIVRALNLDGGVLTGVDEPLKAAMVYKDAIHKGAVFSGEVTLRNPADSVRMLMSAFRVQGLPGASEFARQFHITNPPRALTVAGGIAGAGIGAQEEGWKGALKGGIAGSLVMGSASYGGKAFLKHWPNKSPFKPNTYGYLPDHLFHATMAMRYSLNFFFDIGRRWEQGMMASAKYGLPFTLAPKTHALRNFADDFGGNPEAVLPGIRRELDDVMGSKLATSTEDMERGAQMVGMTGFSQRDADAVYAHYLIKQGKMNKAQIKEAVQTLGHYPARSGAERSLNFVLFPFSFQKKMLTTLGDFMLAEPARALLAHEGMRQWYRIRDESDATMSSRFAELTEKYVPLAGTVGRLNNLSFGISGGRFVLEGIVNNKTLNGKISSALTALFVPGGSVTPLHQAAGKAGDQMVNFFTPIFLTGEDSGDFVSIFEDFAPAVRDFRNVFIGGGANQPGLAGQQFTALTSREATQQGGGGAPWHQLRAYNNERRALKAEYEDLAAAFGYASVDGFLNSEMGAPYKADIDQKEIALGAKYPTGLLKSRHFESSVAVDDQAKAELLGKANRTETEDAIAEIIEMEAEAEGFADMLGMTSAEMLPRLTEDIRAIASRHAGDARFRDLYDRFFSYRYGPIAQVVV